MNNKYDVIANLVNALAKTGDTTSASSLADLLNHNKHKTKKGKEYSRNGRGIYSVIRGAYRHFLQIGDMITACNIASAFVGKNNKHLWKK